MCLFEKAMETFSVTMRTITLGINATYIEHTHIFKVLDRHCLYDVTAYRPYTVTAAPPFTII